MEVDEDPWIDDEPVVCIPFTPSGNAPLEPVNSFPATPRKPEASNGSKERYELYKKAWSECEGRVRDAARQLVAPTLDGIISYIASLDSEDDMRRVWVRKMLPSREIPTALVVGDDKQELFSSLSARIASNDALASCTLLSDQLNNLQTSLKALIEGFVREDEERRRRGATAVASYDMQLLCSWYSWRSSKGSAPKLVVLVRDMESCNAAVLSDMLQICSTYLDRLPFVFVLGAAASDAMTTAFTHMTRSLMSVRKFYLPDEKQRLASILREVFFGSRYPAMVLSAQVMEWLDRSLSAYQGSLDAILSHLQLIFLQHFQRPLTLFWDAGSPELEPQVIEHSASWDATLPSVMAEIGEALSGSSGKEKDDVLSSAKEFGASIRIAKLAFLLLVEVQAYLRELATQPATELSISFPHLMQLFGDGSLGDVATKLLRRIKLLNRAQLWELLGRVKAVTDSMTDTSAVAAEFAGTLEEIRAQVLELEQGEEEECVKHPRSESLAAALQDSLWSRLADWRTLPLRHVWTTGDRVPPIDILNPSLRSSVVSALSHPGNYLLHDVPRHVRPNVKPRGRGARNGTNERTVVDPDVCVLFRRYVEAGKTINVYDWFETFAQALEGTRPAKTKKKKKAKGDKKRSVEEEGEGEGEEEGWRREVYSRFMWSLHELDMLGFLRWTGRGTGKKGAECAGKVVWVNPS